MPLKILHYMSHMVKSLKTFITSGTVNTYMIYFIYLSIYGFVSVICHIQVLQTINWVVFTGCYKYFSVLYLAKTHSVLVWVLCKLKEIPQVKALRQTQPRRSKNDTKGEKDKFFKKKT